MNMPMQEFSDFLATLKRTDFFYHYADGIEYHRGYESFSKALSMRDIMIEKYPNNRAAILQAWQEHGGKV